ncbi:DUF4198 domain-containing protein [Sphingobacterium mizutaii]|uniref:DUF4198 domain-containing protein n=1 Tax=Sphingobacterium mizutaii TaxID=1010 RepID=UPI001626AAFA|nr:DUF4198 domain-containing protein [Sphingobacterium mizutaii]
MNTKTLLTILISLVSLQFASAHALWIETQSNGKLNQKHTVKVFYGEYAEGMVDPVDKWYSDVKDFDLVLIAPDGNKKILEKTAATDHFEASFLPTENGSYILSVVKPAKEAYETMKFEFSSTAFVQVGSGSNSSNSLPFHVESTVLNPKLGSNLEIQVLENGQAEKEREVTIMGPEGWTKTLHTDNQGKASFKPLVKGKYIIEASRTDEKVEEWHGQKIEKIWKGSTYSIHVN